MANESQKKHFCPRLLDYIVIVGSRNPNRNNSVAQTPELLRRYPLEDHKDFPLAPDVVFFCQPEGCISTGPKRLSLRETTSFVFTLTEKDSGRVRFGICVNFFRPFERNRTGTGSERHKAERHQSCASTSSGEQTLNIPQDKDKLQRSPRTKRKQKTARRIRNHTLTSLCLISHHPFFSTFRECLFVLRKLIESCNDRSCPRRLGGPKNLPRDTVWGVITGQSSETVPSLVMHEVREIETWILRLLSAPVPVPGKTRVEVTVLNRELHSPLIFALPDHTRFSLVDFPLHLPLELLGVETCLKVLTMIILEHKIVLQSRDYNALTMSVMAFVAMLYPLEYMFPVIPLLPTCMSSAEQLLLAPTPFIIGVPATFLMYKKGFVLPDDVWLVDLDSNQYDDDDDKKKPKITQPTQCEELPSLPEPEGSVLKNHLKQALASMSMSPQPIKNLEVLAQNPEMWKRRDSFQSEQCFNPLIYGNDVDSVDVATRVAMVRFFNSPNILANFEEHTRTLRLYPRPVVAFQLNSFMTSRPVKTKFTARLARTQAVEYFAEWQLSPFNLVFQRVQTGVYDPLLIGDKSKWYSNQLQKIDFKVYDESHSTLAAAVQAALDAKEEENPTDESGGSDSEGGNSTSSSYSSLSDFVIDIQNSDINGETPMELCEEHQHLTIDEANVYKPPSKLQVPDAPNMSNSDSALSAPDSDEGDTSDSSAPEYSTNDNTGREQVPPHPEEVKPPQKQRPPPLSGSPRQQVVEEEYCGSPPRLSPRTPPRPPPPTAVTPPGAERVYRYDSGRITPTRREGTEAIFRYDNVSPNRKSDEPIFRYDSGRITPTRSLHGSKPVTPETARRTPPPRPPMSPSMKSVDSACDAIGRGQKVDAPFRRAESQRASLRSQTSKPGPPRPPPPHQSSLQKHDSFNRGSTPPGTPHSPAGSGGGPSPGGPMSMPPASPRLSHRSSPTLQTKPPSSPNPSLKHLAGQGPHDPDTASILSTISSELNDYAETASSTFSEIFGNSKSSSSSSISKANKPFAPLGNRQSLVGKSVLVKHPSSKKGTLTKQQSLQERTNKHSDNQQFLKDVITNVLDGQGVGWLKVTRVKNLMEDENYRNFVVSRLNTTLDKKLSDEDIHLEDVNVSKSVFKGMLTVVKALMSGLEMTYQNKGGGGMASAFMVLEIIHTHYWEKDSGSNKSDASNQSLTSSPFGSRESLSSIAAESTKTDARSLPEEPMVPALDNKQQQLQQPPGGQMLYPTRDVDNNIQYGHDQYIALTSPTAPHLPSYQEPDRMRDSSSGYGSESGDMLHQLVKNKELIQRGVRGGGLGQRNQLSKYNSLDSDVSEGSTLLTTGSRKKRSNSILSAKSHMSTGFRFNDGRLMNFNLASPDTNRTYLFEHVTSNKERSHLWDQMQFWEDAFFDAVAQERDIIGMDQGPTEMMERYNSLGDSDKKRLEHDEDRLLSIMLYNMVSFMVMMRVSKNEVRRKVRRMLGKCHIGLVCSKDINNLLDQINNLHGNDIDLKPMISRLMQKQSFTVHWGPDNTGDMLFMEVCDDCIILRSVTGAICDRWWYEKLVNMTYCPKTRVLCLWRKHDGKTQLNKFYTKKCKDLYFCVKDAMEKAAARNNGKIPGAELGGEFPVQDLKSGQGGLLQVCMEGIGLLFANSKELELFIELSRIKKCYTQAGAVFVLEEFDHKTRKVTQHKYKSAMADQICYAVLCVFSYIAAGMEQKQAILENAQHKYRTL